MFCRVGLAALSLWTIWRALALFLLWWRSVEFHEISLVLDTLLWQNWLSASGVALPGPGVSGESEGLSAVTGHCESSDVVESSVVVVAAVVVLCC